MFYEKNNVIYLEYRTANFFLYVHIYTMMTNIKYFASNDMYVHFSFMCVTRLRISLFQNLRTPLENIFTYIAYVVHM